MEQAAAHILIGIPVQDHPERVKATVTAVQPDLSADVRLVFLPDAPGVPAEQLMRELGDLAPLAPEGARGKAACFNRLIRFARADYYLLLEAGSVPASNWLDRLLDAFRRYPSCGLAGPSTNRAWNEQRVFASSSDSPEAIASNGRAAARRFGANCRNLRPLHSLSDFCYMVRSQVVEAIGFADEGFGSGPCWEMDYNIRAHRAGFLGMWACGAYVHRSAPTARQSRDEADNFNASRQRYQDKFCGARLRGVKHDYRDHCRGDACPNFAPAALITIQQLAASAVVDPERFVRPRVATPPAQVCDDPEPLVSCIMPTAGRRKFIPEALACFLAQDYPHRELIVVDDGPDPIADLLPDDPRIRYFHLEGKANIGVKRNFACRQAAGALIAHWDDDEWYHPSRLRRQVETLLDSEFQLSGTTTVYFRDVVRNQAFRYAFQSPGCHWMGALMFRKSAWERWPFESRQVGEDVRFIARIPEKQRRDLRDPELVIAAIHESNTCPKSTRGPYWAPERMDKLDAIVEAARAKALPSIPSPPGARIPLISCIMPTSNRRAFIPLALACFRAQTWPHKELIVVDDGADSVADLLEHQPDVRYIRIAAHRTIGAKRNLACERARGEFIAHWDDDDWYAPERLEMQSAPLRAGTADISGLHMRVVLEMPQGRFWTTTDRLHQRMFYGDVHGGTLMFRRSLLAEQIRYPETNLAEDAALIHQALGRRKRLARLKDPDVFVYLRHGRNAWRFQTGSFLDPAGWTEGSAPRAFTPQLIDAYRTAAASVA